MRTKELIAALQDADPSGEVEVCIDNQDIFFLSQEPGYHNGALERINSNSTDGIFSASILHPEWKLCIYTMSVMDAIEGDPDMPVNYGDIHIQNRYQAELEEFRTQVKSIRAEILKEKKS